ncbi:MAG: PD-(D/E)XK nuclease family protein [Tatlockia sp.]|jgi:probable DNA repair protein
MITSKAQLLDCMQAHNTVLTPNNRLSSALLRDFSQQFPKVVQDKPVCLPYASFLQQQFKKIAHDFPKDPHPFVLSAAQFRYLWRQTLPFSCNEGLLDALIEAWTRVHLWQLDFSEEAFSRESTWQFQQWALTVEEKLVQIGAISEAQLGSYLLKYPHEKTSDAMIWACFDDYTPEQYALMAHLESFQVKMQHFDLQSEQNACFHYAAKDNQDEYQQLILWLKEGLKKPLEKIGVVIPNLQNEFHALKRLLHKHFSKDQFNISLGQSLGEYPLVAHALGFLHLTTETMHHDTLRLLLHSPYLMGSKSEMLTRAQFLEESDLVQERVFYTSTLFKTLNNTNPQLTEILKTIAPYPEKARLADWISLFQNRLEGLGFPGEYPLHSTNYQVYHRFLALFDELKELSLITEVMRQEDALSALVHLAKTAIFQPQKTHATIHVLGLLEAAGATFDALWIAGLTDQCLPQTTKPSPFIPQALQKVHCMPYASPDREWALAEKAIHRFSASSAQVIFSYPRITADKPNMPSPLIGDFPSFKGYTPQESTVRSPLIPYEETFQLPIAATERPNGGTALLANQAKCPFRAFAAHRLHAKTAPSPSDGLASMERGQLIHKVMELLWQSLKNQKNLLAASQPQLEALISDAIERALQPFINKRPHSFSALIQEIERIRLKRLVHAALEWEKQRPDFSVESLEQSFQLTLAGMEFKVRVDRIDTLLPEIKWVIDYKSSLPQSAPWNEDRPQEPQLLLYALLDESIKGLLFSQLKTGQMACKGISEDNFSTPGVSLLKKEQTWTTYRQRWHTQLEDLAQEFAKGYCLPKPLSGTICQLCDFQNLCRYQKEES